MTEQTNSAGDPYIDLIPVEMRADYVRLDTGIDEIDAQIDVLRQERLALASERGAIFDMTAADTDSDSVLVTLREVSDVAAKRLDEAVRSVSPLMYTSIEFSPTDSYTDRHVGPYLSLMSHRERPLADVDPADVVEAAIEFARRFCPAPPQVGEYPGMVCGDILTERDSMTFYYLPDGSAAVLHPRRHGGEVRGTLAEVAVAAVREAQQRAQPRHDDY